MDSNVTIIRTLSVDSNVTIIRTLSVDSNATIIRTLSVDSNVLSGLLQSAMLHVSKISLQHLLLNLINSRGGGGSYTGFHLYHKPEGWRINQKGGE